MICKLKNYLFVFLFLFINTHTSVHASFFQSKNSLESFDYISNYLKGSLSVNHNNYREANLFFSKTKDLAKSHDGYDFRYIYSLAMEGKIGEANKLISALEQKDNFLFQLIQGVYLIKNRNYFLAKKVFISSNRQNPLFDELNNYINLWLDISYNDFSEQELKLKQFKSSFNNIKLIQTLLIYDYVDNQKSYDKISDLILKQTTLGRYHFFHAIHLIKKQKYSEAETIIQKQLIYNQTDLLLKQSYVELKNKNFSFFTQKYDAKNISHGISELLYLFANLLQQQNQTDLSKLIASLSDYLNPGFVSNKLLNFENIILNTDMPFESDYAQTIENIGTEFSWYINFNKLLHSNNIEKKDIIKNLEKTISQNKYFRFSKFLDMANYYRGNKNFELALDYYLKAEAIALPKEMDWKIYYYKGICYERMGQFEKADKQFLLSLKMSPEQYAVINYLAYSWLERGVNLPESKKMLEKAVRLSKWELGYIIDSLGWAYYLQNNFNEAEKLLQLAYEKSPQESEVYDHYADVLWKNNKKLQARYVWKNATRLPNIDKERLSNINKKLTYGIQ